MLDRGPLPPWQAERFERLSARFASDNFPTALLLVGPEGVGKRHLGDALVRSAYCEQRDTAGHACGDCHGCHQLAAGSHPDLVLCEPAEGKQSITVDVIREFSRKLYLTPQSRAGRIGYIPQADLMNANAANALLKTLEEPPASAHLILIADRPAHLPATIRSRCEQVRSVIQSGQHTGQWLQDHFPELPEALRQTLLTQPMLAESAAGTAQQDASIRKQLEAVWTQKRDPMLAAADIDENALPRLGRIMHAGIMDRLRQQARSRLSPPRRLAMQRLVDANAAALHLSETSQANLRLLVETQLIEWARVGRLFMQDESRE